MEELDFLSTLNENLIVKSVDELKNELFISDLCCGKIKFLTVVESIQGVLTNENINVRERGVEFLSWILTEAPVDLFSGTEITVIISFYCSCLKGHHNLLPAVIKGLLAVVKMKNVSVEDVIKILQQMFQEVNCRTQLQEDRYNIFCILKLTVEKYIKDLKQMGPDLVFGIISFIEGETDPSNLLLIFNFLPFFIKNFELGHLDEEMFELLSCYFPIDFNSAAKERCLITREDLAQGLAWCLSASDAFCKLCLPLIFEKLDSSFKTAKLDSYKLLEECCQNLKAEGLENHLNELWKSMQKDILPGNDKAISEAGLAALNSVVSLLSKEELHSTAFSSFLNDILTTIKSLINKVDENIFQPAMKVLLAVSSSSKTATAQILHLLTPFFYLKSTPTISERKIILSSLLPLLKCCHAHRISTSESEVLTSYFELINLYFDSTRLHDTEVRKLAFAGIDLLLPDLNQDYRTKLFEIIVDNIKTKEDIKSSEELLKVWRSLALINKTEFHKVLSKDFCISTTGDQIEPETVRLLWALSFVADISSFSGFVIPIFINVILSSHHYIVGLENVLNACKYAKVNESEDFFHTLYAEHNILERLVSWWLDFYSKESEKARAVILILSEVIARLVRSQSLQSQQNIADNFIEMFLNESSPLSNGGESFNGPKKGLLTKSFFTNNHTVLILEAVLGSVRPETMVPKIFIIQKKLTSLSLTSDEDLIRLSSSRLLASLVNKAKEPLASDLVSRITKDIFTQLEESTDSRLKLNCSFLFTWIMKGLLLKGDQEFENWVSTWFDLLGRTDVGEGIAEGFRTVVGEDELYLNLESHCNVKILYRQRLFGYFPKLIKLYETCEASVKTNYLLALILLLQGIPNHLIEAEISSIIILFVQCLNTDKPEVLLTSLEILKELLESRKKIFSDYIQSFVPRFLILARLEGHMKIRKNALKCLYYYGFYPTVVLLPFKSQVIRGLECCLGDKKRLVRKDAVRARCRWFLVGSPGEDILES